MWIISKTRRCDDADLTVGHVNRTRWHLTWFKVLRKWNMGQVKDTKVVSGQSFFWLCLLNVIIMYSVLSSYSSPPWTQSSNTISRGTRAKNHKCKSYSLWVLEATHTESVWTQGEERMLQPPSLLRGRADRGAQKETEVFQRWCSTASHPSKNIVIKG